MPTFNNPVNINPLDLNKNAAIGVAFPFNAPGVFKQTYTYNEQIKSNLINLLVTKKGERINEPNFGVGIQNLLFEPNIDVDALKTEINNQINIFIPDVDLFGVEASPIDEKHRLHIKITYRFKYSDKLDAIALNLSDPDYMADPTLQENLNPY